MLIILADRHEVNDYWADFYDQLSFRFCTSKEAYHYLKYAVSFLFGSIFFPPLFTTNQTTGY